MIRNYRPEGSTHNKTNNFRIDVLDGNTDSIFEASAIKCDNELNLYIDLGPSLIGVIRPEEFEYVPDAPSSVPVKSVAVITRVGKQTCFKVLEVSDETTEDGKTIVYLSRREAQKDCYDNYISKLQIGQVIDARITHIENYGAFCDIGCGIIALLPVEHFCVARIIDPKVALKQFKNLKVIVRDIAEDGKIILSQKELLGTWEENAAKFEPETVVVGTVRTVKDYGIFVELTPNFVALAEPFEGVNMGDAVSVFIKSIIPEKMKVKLIIVEADNVAKPFVKLDYKIPEDGFVRHWVYSPESSTKKRIESFIGVEPESDKE